MVVVVEKMAGMGTIETLLARSVPKVNVMPLTVDLRQIGAVNAVASHACKSQITCATCRKSVRA